MVFQIDSSLESRANVIVVNYFSVAVFENPVDGGRYQIAAFIRSIQHTMVLIFRTIESSFGLFLAGNIQQYHSISI